MQGIKLLTHSIRLVLGNWKEALQIWLLPMLICWVVFGVGFAVLGQIFGGATQFRITAADPGFGTALPVILTIITVTSICMLWGVVGWHQFILNDEKPRGYLPVFHSKNAVGYFVQALLILLILILPMFIVMYVSAFTVSVMVQAGVGLQIAALAILLFNAVINTAFVCMSPAMVGRALGKDTSIADAVLATSGKGVGQIFLCVLIGYIAFWLIQTGLEGLALVSPMIVSVLSIPLALVIGLVQVSILTTVYGHYVEERPLT